MDAQTHRKIRTVAVVVGLAVLIGCDRSSPADAAVKPAAQAPGPVTPPSATQTPSQPPRQPATTSTEKRSGPARIAFENVRHDFGQMPETETRRATFTFRNEGGERLVINEVKTSCGCTAATLAKLEYEGGESGTIEVEFHPSAPGDQKQYVNVFSNSGKEPTRVMITADVQAFINIEPRMLRLGVMTYGEEFTTSVEVTSPAPDFVINRVYTLHPHVTAKLRPPSPGSDTRIVDVTISRDAAWGSIATRLKVSGTGTPEPGGPTINHESTIRVQGQIFGQLIGEPDTFRFGTAPGETFERTVVLTHRTGLPFRVISTVVRPTPYLTSLEITVEPRAPNEYELVMVATAGDRPLQVDTEVVLTTDIPGEETLSIPIVGVIRWPPGTKR